MQSAFTETLPTAPLANLTSTTSSPSYSMGGAVSVQVLDSGLYSRVEPFRYPPLTGEHFHRPGRFKFARRGEPAQCVDGMAAARPATR